MSSDTPTRRRFLSRTVVVASALATAGCLTGGPGDSDDRASGTTADNANGNTAVHSEPSGETSTDTGDTTTERPPTVSFEAPHGATIEATSYGSGACGVVLVPQVNVERGSWQPQGEMLAEMGHLALAIDEDPEDRAASVRGAIQYLRQQQSVSSIVLVGASTGGEAVLVANAETDATVDGTITLSAAGGADHASELQGRSLFVVSEDDEDRFVRIARELHRGAPEPKELVEYGGDAHGQGLFDSEHGGGLRNRVRTFTAEVCAD
ncbi:dienelactone hydrolase family protein [Halobacterium bonnevillei]|uniref:Alpha/beta hydrolase n=1 Tax=Halobacterium bonnevillei TaxID=2692200 RepID=A0A6B0SEJ0_9EURY|nr:hypothetical protein [Halobacterium bonnevillei]MXR20164.1 hypothetical protein [Halobacterium bonnevillei]